MPTVTLVIDFSTMHRSLSGAIWGRIFLDFGDKKFPDPYWDDLTTPILSAWLDAVSRLISRIDTSAAISFMDGPFEVRLDRIGNRQCLLTCIDRHQSAQTVCSAYVDIRSFGESLIGIAKIFISRCAENRWRDAEIDNLSRDSERLSDLLRG
jgi:hypothetical protein